MTELLALTEEEIRLNEMLKRLRAEFLELFTLHRDMVDNQSPILTSVYLEKLGYLQLELLQKKTEAARLKMKMQLIQAAINQDKKPDLRQIEEEIRRKLESYYEQIKNQSAALDSARQILSHLLSEEESKKLKELFRLLCKKLHPDLNPGESEERKELFIKVKAAYDLQDIEELQKILLYVDGFGEMEASPFSAGDKRQTIAHLEKCIADLKEKIRQLEENFPFTMKLLIYDESFISNNREKLQHQIRFFEKSIRTYKHYISIMINE